MILPLTQLYSRIRGRRLFDELKIKKDVQGNGTGLTEIIFRTLNVMVSIPMCLKIRYKDYISQTHPIYFSC